MKRGTINEIIYHNKNAFINPLTTWNYFASNFATFSATKICINKIMGGKSVSKLPFRIIFRA